MAKFKVGDTVKITGGTGSYHNFKNGAIGTITKVHSEDASCQVEVKGVASSQCINQEDLLLIKPPPKFPHGTFWVNLEKDLREKYEFPEDTVNEIIESLRLKQAVKELTTKDLSCVED